MAQLGADAAAEHQRQRAEQRGHRRHHDRPEAQQARLVDRVARRLAFLALGVEREVDHHDRVLLDDADQQDDADDRDDAEVVAGDDQREQRADAGRRQRRQDRDRVDVALVQHAEHDVHRDDRGEDQPAAVGERACERERRALEAWSATLAGTPSSCCALLDRLDRVAERRAGREVERDRRRGKLADVIDGQRRRALADRAIDDSGTCCATAVAPPSGARAGAASAAEALAPPRPAPT